VFEVMRIPDTAGVGPDFFQLNFAHLRPQRSEVAPDTSPTWPGCTATNHAQFAALGRL